MLFSSLKLRLAECDSSSSYKARALRVGSSLGSGDTLVGVPERIALKMSACGSKEEFEAKHVSENVLFPLFAHFRISRTVSSAASGASQPTSSASQGAAGASQPAEPSHGYVSQVIEDVEVATWNPTSAPNASYNKILDLLNCCPQHDGAIIFANLGDVFPDPHYGFEVRFRGTEPLLTTKGKAVAALIRSEQKSDRPLAAGEGFKVVTQNVKDAVDSTNPDAFTVAAYCTLGDMMEYKLDPPRSQKARWAVVLISNVEPGPTPTFLLDKVEFIEPAEVDNAVKSFQKLRRMATRLQPSSTEKKSHSLASSFAVAHPPKKCRTLTEVPTDASLPETATPR